jgi:hypothetical protein
MTEQKISEISKISKKFICEKCNYVCSKQSEFTKHLATLKHTTLSLDLEKIAKSYPCVCGKEYKHSQSLHTHKKTCQTIINNDTNNKIIQTTNKMIQLLQQNNELLLQTQELKEVIVEQKDLILEQKEIILEHKDVIIEQTEYNKKVLEKITEQTDIANENRFIVINQAEQQTEHNSTILEIAREQAELTKEQTELTKEQKELTIEQIEQNKQLMEMIKEKGLGQHIVNHNNTNNNNFNLNFFLNDTCKDALTVDQFIKYFKEEIKVEMIKAFEHLSHVDGVSNALIQVLDSLPETSWPMHCTDVSRGIVHMKVDNKWEKENNEVTCPHQTKMIRHAEDNLFDYMIVNKEVKTDEDVYDTIFGHVVGNKCDESVRNRETVKIKNKMSSKTVVNHKC